MILEIIILLLAFPAGFLIAWLARDELHAGRKWFFALMVLSLIGVISFLIYGTNYISWTFSFVFVVAGVSWVKSRKVKIKNK